MNMSFTYGLYASQADRSSCHPSLKCVCCCSSRLRIMPPTVTVSKSVRAMPDQIEGLHPAAKGGGKRTGGGRFKSRRRTKTQKQRAKATETAAREESSQDVAASTQRSAAELTTLRADVECLSKENKKMVKQTESLQKQLESERQRSRIKEECVKELSAATVESDIAHAEHLAKVCSHRESWSRTVCKLKAQSSKGSLSAIRCREKAKAIKDTYGAPCIRRPPSAVETYQGTTGPERNRLP
jgi:hypothetical protein